MKTCDEYQIDCEKLRYGALSLNGQESLEQHLGSCQECNQFNQNGARMEMSMRTDVIQAIEKTDWNAIRNKLSAKIRRHQLVTQIGRVGWMLAIVFFVWALGTSMGHLKVMGIGVAGAIFFFFFGRGRQKSYLAKAASAASSSDEELTVFYQKDLDSMIKAREINRITNVISSVCSCVFVGLYSSNNPAMAIFFLVLGISLFSLGAYFHFSLPTLRRERDTLN